MLPTQRYQKKVSMGLREKRTSRDAVYAVTMVRNTSATSLSGTAARVTTFPTEVAASWQKGGRPFEGKEEAGWRRR